MTDPNRQADALLTEHFQYTPLSLIDDIINAVNTIIYQAIEALENGLLQIPPRSLGFVRFPTATTSPFRDENSGDANTDYPEATAEIENGVHQLETLLESTVDKAFDKFEIYTLRSILTIPDDLAPWMRLAHYENLPLPLPAHAPTPESLFLLRRQLQETRKLNLALQSTHTRNAAIITQLSALLSTPKSDSSTQAQPQEQQQQDSHSTSSLAFLTSSSTNNNNPAIQTLNLSFSPSSKESRPLTTNAQFATSQLPALRELVAELRGKMVVLREGGGKGDAERQGRREERRRYIEGGARRVVGGVLEEVGGETRRREEVEGLEGVVGGLRRG